MNKLFAKAIYFLTFETIVLFIDLFVSFCVNDVSQLCSIGLK